MTDFKQLLSRGVAQVLPSAESLQARLEKKPIRLYLGIDPTGTTLTLGHAVVLRKLQQFSDAGHEVILLVGNGTVRIGDPTGRDSTRPVLTDEDIAKNFSSWQQQASRIIDLTKITLRHNGEWLDKLNYADLVRLMGKVTVQQLLERDMFQERIKKGQPVFGHELMYPLLQGYDSVVMEVDLEIGGTDQTFNMLMGRDLLKTYKNREKWVLTTPIINGTDGRKMSKSYDNFIGITDEPNDMFGKIMSVRDEEMLTYFEIFTEEDLENAKKIIAADPRAAKAKLAKHIVSWLHSESEASTAEEAFVHQFRDKGVPDDLPVFVVTSGMGLVEIITEVCGFASSRTQARKLIQQGAVSLDGEKRTDENAPIEVATESVLKVGKRQWAKLKNES